MAKKIVNVVYKVDNAELAKVQGQLKIIQKETETSEKKMQSFSQSASQGNIKVSNTIAGMTLQMQQLQARIELTNTADKKRLSELNSQYNQVKQKLDEVNKSLEKTATTTASFKDAISGIFSAIIIRQIVSMNLELTKLAGTAEGVERAFTRAFKNAPALMNDLRKATHNTVSDLELMQQTLRATNLGVSVEHLATLFEFAAARAQQTGESVDYLVDSVVRGIGRKSILVLDNLGLSATRLREQFGGAAIASKTVGEVTEGVAAIAQVELTKMGGYVDTAATKTAQLEAAWKNLKLEVAKKTESSGLVDFLTNAVNRLADQFGENVSEKNAQEEGIENAKKFINASKQTKETLDAEIKARQAKFLLLIDEQKALKTSDKSERERGLQFQLIRFNILKEAAALEVLGQAMEDIEVPEKKQAGVIAILEDQISNLNDEIKAASLEQLPALNSKLEELQKKLKIVQLIKTPTEAVEKEIDPAQAVADANEMILEQTESDYQKALDLLHDQQDKEKKEKDANRDFNLKRAKEQADEELRIEKEKEDNKKRIRQAAIDFGLASLTRILQFSLINREQDLEDLDSYYDAQIEAAGNNEAAKKQIEKKRKAEQEKQRLAQIEQDQEDALTKIAIDTAVGVIRALITPPIPNFLLAGIVAGAGLVQAATVRSVSGKSLRSRAFAEGEINIDGPGTTTSDSINAKLSRGESVINAEATSKSMNLLEAINNREIDDRILQKLSTDGGRQTTPFDDSRMVNAIIGSRIELEKQGLTLYRYYQESENFKIKRRAKI